MCCLVEKEVPIRIRRAYSGMSAHIDYPKDIFEKADEYRSKTPDVIQGKLIRKTPGYTTRKKKRSMIVLREHTAKGDYTRHFGSHEMFTHADMRRQARREMDLSLLHWMRANRPKTIEVLSVIVIASMIFSLISSLLFGMHIVNPIPALLILVTFIGFFAMAKSAERSNADR